LTAHSTATFPDRKLEILLELNGMQQKDILREGGGRHSYSVLICMKAVHRYQGASA